MVEGRYYRELKEGKVILQRRMDREIKSRGRGRGYTRPVKTNAQWWESKSEGLRFNAAQGCDGESKCQRNVRLASRQVNTELEQEFQESRNYGIIS
jgi:hypothetical protein